MKKLRKVMNLLKVNWKTLAGFEILYKILSFTVFTPLFLGCFHGIMKATGYNYLTLENIGSFLLNPVTVAGLLLLLFLIVLAGLELLLLKWLYAFHYFTLEGCNFKEARKRSRHLSKNHRGRDLLTLLGCQTVLALLYFLFLLSVAGFSFYLYGISNHKIELRTEHEGIMEVTAHRGASSFYPENTMAAFEGAARLGTDWIELDVQQSGDGQIIVLHDTSFKRTTGVAGNTWELAYEEIEKLDNGSFFDSRFAGEKIPLLAEVISFAKEHDIKLNIELKPTGHETDFEKNVVDLIEAADFADSCVITSQVYEVLERVKAYRENIRTVYVMSFAYGDINQLGAADHFSIEATSVTEKMVFDVHNAGKELYAWTVNTEENIDRMIELHVDNIITDNVTLAKERIFLSRTGNLWEKYVKFLQEL
ncbi:glycerophosphodiester phosphodiesterase family protein [Lachnospiraceae bacterium KK002]